MQTCKDIILERWNEIDNDESIFEIKTVASSHDLNEPLFISYKFTTNHKKPEYKRVSRYVPKGLQLIEAEIVRKPESEYEYDKILDVDNDYLLHLIYDGVLKALKSSSKSNIEDIYKLGQWSYHHSFITICQGCGDEKFTFDLYLFPEGFKHHLYNGQYSTYEGQFGWENFILGDE